MDSAQSKGPFSPKKTAPAISELGGLENITAGAALQQQPSEPATHGQARVRALHMKGGSL